MSVYRAHGGFARGAGAVHVSGRRVDGDVWVDIHGLETLGVPVVGHLKCMTSNGR